MTAKSLPLSSVVSFIVLPHSSSPQFHYCLPMCFTLNSFCRSSHCRDAVAAPGFRKWGSLEWQFLSMGSQLFLINQYIHEELHPRWGRCEYPFKRGTGPCGAAFAEKGLWPYLCITFSANFPQFVALVNFEIFDKLIGNLQNTYFRCVLAAKSTSLRGFR